MTPTAATRGSECVGHDAWTKWSPESCRRRVQAAAQSGERREAATACQRGNGEGEDDQKLTQMTVGWTASSGKDERRRI